MSKNNSPTIRAAQALREAAERLSEVDSEVFYSLLDDEADDVLMPQELENFAEALEDHEKKGV